MDKATIKQQFSTFWSYSKPHFNFIYGGAKVINYLPKKDERTVFSYVELVLSFRNLVEVYKHELTYKSCDQPYEKLKQQYHVTSWNALNLLLFQELMACSPTLTKSLYNSSKDERMEFYSLAEHGINFSIYFSCNKFGFLTVPKAEDVGKLFNYITNKIWLRHNCNVISFNEELMELVPLDFNNVLNSSLSDRIYRECENYFKIKINRSMLFYGPPGSGKSNTIKSICHKLRLRTFKISLLELKSDNAILMIKLLRPDILIIDDVDHAIGSIDKILGVLENANCDVKLILASANVITKLDPALQRPGRFDELIEVKSLDAELHQKLVHNDEELYRFTANFPAAYIVEFMKRVSVKGKDRALSESSDLLKRVENFKTFNYDLSQASN